MEPPTMTRHAYFELPRSQDADVSIWNKLCYYIWLRKIWLVLRVEKVLQGDPDDVREPYTKLDDEKGMKKAKAKVSEVFLVHLKVLLILCSW